MENSCIKYLNNWLERPLLSRNPNDEKALFEAIKNCILHDVKINDIKEYVKNNVKYINSRHDNITRKEIEELLLMIERTYMPMLYFCKGIITFS